MNITVQMNVYNAEDFLFYSLSSIYDFADRIVIIDGAYNEEMPTPFSTDKTAEIVESFPDKDKKIIYRTTSSKTQVEQRNKGLEHAIGDWLFIVDHDEVYKEEELEQTRNFLATTKGDAFWIKANVFLNSFNWYFPLFYPRIFRLKEGIKFVGPNFFIHSGGKYVARRDQPRPPLIMYHYSFVEKGERLVIRQQQRKVQLDLIDIKGKYKRWDNRLHANFQNGLWIVPKAWGVRKFEGEHPIIMKNHPLADLNKDWKPTKFLREDNGILR